MWCSNRWWWLEWLFGTWARRLSNTSSECELRFARGGWPCGFSFLFLHRCCGEVLVVFIEYETSCVNIYAKCSYFASQCFLLVSSVRALDAVESLLNAFACQTEPHMPSRVVFRRSFGTTQVVSTIFRVCLFWSFWKMPYVKVTVVIKIQIAKHWYRCALTSHSSMHLLWHVYSAASVWADSKFSALYINFMKSRSCSVFVVMTSTTEQWVFVCN